MTFYVKKDLRVSLAGTDLIVSNVTEGDAGDYICKLDTDDEIPLTVSHSLPILGTVTKYMYLVMNLINRA